MATWFQRFKRRILHAFDGPPDLNQGPDGRTSLLQRGPQYSEWLLEQLRGNNQTTVPAAARAHDVLVGALMACDFRLVRQAHDGAPPEELDEHPIHRLLNYPSRVCASAELWKGYYSDYLRGNSYFFIRRTQDGLPIELVPVSCSKTVVEGNPVSRAGVSIEHYLSPVFGDKFPERETWRDRHVARIHWPNSWQPRTFKSLPPIAGYAASVIQNNALLQQHYARRLSRPLPSSSVIEMDSSVLERTNNMDYKDFIEYCSQFGDTLAEWMRQDKVLTLPPGMSVASGIADLDLKAIELLDLTVDEVARIYGTPPSFLYRYHIQSFRALEQENTAFARRTVLLHADLIGAELTRKLLTPQEQMDRQRIMLDVAPLELGTLTERIAAATMATADSGLWSVNEGRRMTGQPPRDDGDRCFEPRGGPATRTPQQGTMPLEQQAAPLITPQNGHGEDALSRPSS